MMLITQNQAAENIGVNRSTVSRDANKNPDKLPFVFIDDRVMVETDCAEWEAYKAKKQSRGRASSRDKAKIIKKDTVDNAAKTSKKQNIPHSKLKESAESLKKQQKTILKKANGETAGESASKQVSTAEEMRIMRERESMAEIEQAMKDGKALEISPLMTTNTLSRLEKVFKGKKAMEEALIKQNQRRMQEKELVEIEMGLYLTGSFMQQVKTELGNIPKKIMPQIQALIKSGDGRKAEELMKDNMSAVLKKVIEQQIEAVENWKKEK